MAKGISIGIAGDAKEFASAVQKGVIAPLEDADDAVKDIGRDASRLGELESNMQDAQKATSKYEGELQDAIEAQKKAARGARDIGDDAKSGFHDAGNYSSEFKDEALANFSEVTSSFDGSMTSVVDLAQGTFGGLASLGGPVGLALGGLAALVGGVFAGMATSADENSQKAAKSIQDMYDDMVESGQAFVSQDFVNQKIQEIIANQSDLNKVKQDAARAAVSEQTALRAEAGDRDALNTVLESAKAQYDGLRDRIDTVIKNGGKVSGELSGQASAAHDLVTHYQDLAANQDTATAKADLYKTATSNTSAAMSDAAVKAQGLKASLAGIPDSKQVSVSVTGVDGVMRQLDRISGRSLDIIVTGRTRAGDRVF